MATATQSLIQTNVHWLRQALALLDRVSDHAYATVPASFAPQRAGGHLRHILEFYQCFVEGAATLDIDYDARRRDRAVEESRAAAAATIRSLIRTLESSPDLGIDATVWVREEDGDQFLESTINRELQVLSSHTIHHFALLALTCACTVWRWIPISAWRPPRCATCARRPRRLRNVYRKLAAPTRRLPPALQP